MFNVLALDLKLYYPMILPSLQYLANELNRCGFDNPIDPVIELGNVARLDLETVVSPEASVLCPPPPPPPRPPSGLPVHRTRWAADLGLL